MKKSDISEIMLPILYYNDSTLFINNIKIFNTGYAIDAKSQFETPDKKQDMTCLKFTNGRIGFIPFKSNDVFIYNSDLDKVKIFKPLDIIKRCQGKELQAIANSSITPADNSIIKIYPKENLIILYNRIENANGSISFKPYTYIYLTKTVDKHYIMAVKGNQNTYIKNLSTKETTEINFEYKPNYLKLNNKKVVAVNGINVEGEYDRFGNLIREGDTFYVNSFVRKSSFIFDCEILEVIITRPLRYKSFFTYYLGESAYLRDTIAFTKGNRIPITFNRAIYKKADKLFEKELKYTKPSYYHEYKKFLAQGW